MKYYHELVTATYSDGSTKEIDYGYDIGKLPVGIPIWAVAYDIDNDTCHVRLRCLPTMGEIVLDKYPKLSVFKEYKRGSSELRSSGAVYYDSRYYADTYDEAVELYNELVQKRIDRLKWLINDAKQDKLE